jgi:hypothetical protein
MGIPVDQVNGSKLSSPIEQLELMAVYDMFQQGRVKSDISQKNVA